MLVTNISAWSPLKAQIKKIAANPKKAFKYVANEGNAGDALIGTGTWQFFEDCQVAPEFATTSNIFNGDSVIYSGGGNLVPEYTNCRDFLERCLQVGVSRAMVLPHSIRGHHDLLRRLDSRFTLVCRDQDSVQRVMATGTKATVMFAPDMALYIDVQRLFDLCDSYRGIQLWTRFVRNRQLHKYIRWQVALRRLRPTTRSSLTVLRTDAEATLANPGDPMGDLPSFYGSQYKFREEFDLVSRDLLGILKAASSVRTNRLHVGVAGALVGCEVTYFDNSYGKIRALYDAWLSHIPTVKFENPLGHKPKFSLIMGTLGRISEIGRFLASLQRQDYRDFELFIVDQNPDDRLLPLITEYRQFFNIERVISPSGLSRARNAGLPLITGDVVAFPDDDCWYPDGLLSYIAARFQVDTGLDGLTGSFVNEHNQSEGRWLKRSQPLNQYSVWRGAISFSIFLRRRLVDKIGNFDEKLGVGAGTPWGAGEETDYLLRGLKAGGNILFDRELVLRHPVKTSNFDEAARERQGRYEAGFGRVIRRAGFPMWYFPWVCSRTLCGALLALATGRSAQARFKLHSVQARISGWMSGAK